MTHEATVVDLVGFMMAEVEVALWLLKSLCVPAL
jgi:hypothetical protein